ncbi:hypothetical protein D3C87_1080550 [compost metagenome]
MLAVGQHCLVGRQLHAAERHAVEEVARRAAVADQQLAVDRCDVALRIGVDALPAALAVDAPVVGGEVAKAPVAVVEAGAQACEQGVALKVLPALAERTSVEDALRQGEGVRVVAVLVAAVAREVELVIQHAGGDALVPFFRADCAARRALERRLRNAHEQALLAGVIAERGLGSDGLQVNARVLRGIGQCRKHGHVDTPCIEHAAREARLRIIASVSSDEADLGLSLAALVEGYIDHVLARKHAIAKGK